MVRLDFSWQQNVVRIVNCESNMSSVLTIAVYKAENYTVFLQFIVIILCHCPCNHWSQASLFLCCFCYSNLSSVEKG